MTSRRFPLVVRRTTAEPFHHSRFALSDVARLADLHPAFIEKLVNLGLIDPVEMAPEPLFDAATILRLRRIVRLRNDLGVNWAGIGLVLDLLARIEELEQEMTRLKATLSGR